MMVMIVYVYKASIFHDREICLILPVHGSCDKANGTVPVCSGMGHYCSIIGEVINGK